MPGFLEFEFDLPGALKTELIRLIDGMDTGLLQPDVTNDIPDAQGVYQLFYEDALVYIGKTDAEAGLRTRLTRHAWKIKDRPSLTGTVRFKAVRILVFTAMDLETQLIKHYRQLDPNAAPWNGGGFGSNDPGRKREETNASPEGFDATHPIDIDLPFENFPAGEYTVAEAASKLKRDLPYTLRFETLRDAWGRALRGSPHQDMIDRRVAIPPGPHTTRQLLQLFVQALGPDWQATKFASHVILYKESRPYAFGTPITGA